MTEETTEFTSADGEPAIAARSSWRRLGRFARKELRESLRDRRTLVTLIVMPLLVYPLLGTVVQRFALSGITQEKSRALVIADLSIPGEHLLAIFGPDVADMEAVTDPRRRSATPAGESTAELSPAATDPDSVMSAISGDIAAAATEIELQVMEVGGEGDQLDEVVRLGEADVALRNYPAVTDPATGQQLPPVLEIISRQGDRFSARAADIVERRVVAFRDRMMRTVLDRARVGGNAMASVSRYSLQAAGTERTMLLGAFIPLVLVLMTMTGAVYPAIDLTAGERERGTLEMLMAAPVSRRLLLTGKFIAVCMIAIMTAVVNLIAMMTTIYSIGFDRIVFGDGLTIGVVLQIFLLLVVFASFFSAVLLSVTSVARSFREAQAYIIPLMLVSLAPGILSLMPNVQLSLGLAFVPLVNIVLLGRDLFQGKPDLPLFLITILATLSYTVLSLRLAGSVFGSHASLYGNAGGVAELWKRAAERRSSCSLPRAVACFGLIVPLFLLLSGLRGRILNVNDINVQLIYSGGVILLLFGLLPMMFAVWDRVDLAAGFRLRLPVPTALVGATLLGISLWPFAYEALMLLRSDALAQLLGERAAELKDRITAAPISIRLSALALIPAICEELFFRGFLLTSLQEQGARRGQIVLITAALFAGMHVVVDQALMMERFVPSFLLGVVLAAIRLRTGSVIPGIVLHLVHNALLLSLPEMTSLLQLLQLDLEGETHLPAWFLVTSAGIAVAGGVLVWLGGSRQRLVPRQI
jgi:sodium transport system permease protein